MKVNPAPLHLAQGVVTGLILAFSIAALGTSAHTLAVFNKEQPSNPWWLPMWPLHFDVHGTKAMVGTSTVVVVLSSVFLALSVLPNFKQRYTLRFFLGLALTIPSAVLSLVTVVYVHALNKGAPDVDTIQTWTCRYKYSRPVEQNVTLPNNMGNNDFHSLCRESKFAVYGTLAVFVLLILSMALTVITWPADKVAEKQSKKEKDMIAMQAQSVVHYP